MSDLDPASGQASKPRDPGRGPSAGRSAPGGRISLRRRLLFALVPVLLLVGGGELVLRLVGWEGTTVADLQATAGFSRGAYIHRRDRSLGSWIAPVPGDPDRVQTRPELRVRGMHDVSFTREPAPGVRRLFALGGSTTYGIPYEIEEQGFPERLGRSLARHASPARWEVLNLGVAGLDSRALPEMVEELLAYEPHGLVLYTGNNELRGALLHACSAPYREGLLRWLDRVRLLRLGRNLWRIYRGADAVRNVDRLKATQAACMDRFLDERWAAWHARGVEREPPSTPAHRPAWKPAWPARLDPQYAQVVEDFRANLLEVSRLTRAAGVRVWIALPPVNLLHPPEDPRPSPGVAPEDLPSLRRAVDEMEQAWEDGAADRFRTAWSRARALDPVHGSVLWYGGLHAHLYGPISEGVPLDPVETLHLAADRDYQGDRITRHLVAVIEDLCGEGAMTCVDVAAAFTAAAGDPLSASELFADFCHPRRERGVQLVADAFHAAIAPRAPLPEPAPKTPAPKTPAPDEGAP